MRGRGTGGAAAGAPKWQPQQPPPQAAAGRGGSSSHGSPNTPAQPTGFEDAAVTEFAVRQHAESAAAAAAAVPSNARPIYYMAHEGSDTLSNIFFSHRPDDPSSIAYTLVDTVMYEPVARESSLVMLQAIAASRKK